MFKHNWHYNCCVIYSTLDASEVRRLILLMQCMPCARQRRRTEDNQRLFEDVFYVRVNQQAAFVFAFLLICVPGETFDSGRMSMLA